FTSAAHALFEVQNLKPDVVFLDIEMPEMSGLELAEKMIAAGNNMEIVFVTAYDKYALEAFRVNAIDYLLKPLSFDDVLQTITRIKKRRPMSVPSKLSKDKGHIYCFGRLLVYAVESQKAVKWRTSKAEELFAFMLQNLNKEVSKWKITQVLWPECETEKLNVYLHTTIYKVKKTLLATNIKFDFEFINGRYKLKLPEVYVDTEEFEAITNAEITLSTASIERFEKAISLYEGNYLEENNYLWSQNKAEEYSIRYQRLVLEFVKYYITNEDYAKAEKILRKALINIPMDDELNEMLLKLYVVKKDRASLVMHYNKIKELYETELGILPNATIQELYNKIVEM
ncbi:MAG: response regulator, partial [Lachnospiraceae bacterium]|nr:response regulator [Lachnospiraceae bacterium]